MSVLKIETGKDNPILRAKSKEVEKIDKKLLKFIENMKETMMVDNGLGIASPQVGVNLRVIVCHLNYDSPNAMIIPMINPKITFRSEEMIVGEEGCLSLPDQFGDVERHKEIVVKFLDKKGNEQVLRLEGMNATVVQHEVDHLDGVLFIDRVKNKVMVEGE